MDLFGKIRPFSHSAADFTGACFLMCRGLAYQSSNSSWLAMANVTELKIELEQEEDGRWIGEIPALPGVMAYGQTKAAALAAVQVLALRTMADRLEHDEAVPEELLNVSFLAA